MAWWNARAGEEAWVTTFLFYVPPCIRIRTIDHHLAVMLIPGGLQTLASFRAWYAHGDLIKPPGHAAFVIGQGSVSVVLACEDMRSAAISTLVVKPEHMLYIPSRLACHTATSSQSAHGLALLVAFRPGALGRETGGEAEDVNLMDIPVSVKVPRRTKEARVVWSGSIPALGSVAVSKATLGQDDYGPSASNTTDTIILVLEVWLRMGSYHSIWNSIFSPHCTRRM